MSFHFFLNFDAGSGAGFHRKDAKSAKVLVGLWLEWQEGGPATKGGTNTRMLGASVGRVVAGGPRMRSEYPNGDRQSPTWRLSSGAARICLAGAWIAGHRRIRVFVAPIRSRSVPHAHLALRWGRSRAEDGRAGPEQAVPECGANTRMVIGSLRPGG